MVGAHSARSVDGGIPTEDSNIINLAITPFARGQGFSAAKGRNLGFVNEASLNAVPAGINNELSNVDVRGSTPQPAKVLRDSYGNPVTPFTDLAKPEVDSVGFLTNVNRGANFQSPNGGNSAGKYNFKVPSYASGILEPIAQPNFSLLPPNPAPQTVQAVPPSSTTTVRPLGSVSQFLPNAKIPTIEEGKILFAQKPVNGLLPPLFPDQLPPVYDVKVGTERSPIFVRDPFGGSFVTPSLQSSQQPNNAVSPVDGAVGFKTDVNRQTNFPQPDLGTANRFSGAAAAPAGSTTNQLTSPPFVATTKAPVVQKYNGGFGGSAGFLGNQQNLGTAYTSTVKPNAVPQLVHSQSSQQQPRPQPTFIPQNTLSTTARTADKPTVQKYTGSFGGSSGFLGNQANIGTAYTKPPQAVSVFTGAPVPVPPQQPSPVHNFASAQPPSVGAVAARPQPQQPVVPQTVPNKFNGPFNGGPVGQSSGSRPTIPPASVQPQQPLRPSTVSSAFNGGNKFTGSFGGAPGILGNQQRPGTHVKPDGTAFAPALAQPTQQQQQQQPQALVSQLQPSKPVADTFTGSFGGPPGVLRPFDTTKG
uniref:Uncharacterized protein n=1 Tax=Anopheles farauti TaxID=69004 RepID=A0A182QHJ1_9DIPT